MDEKAPSFESVANSPELRQAISRCLREPITFGEFERMRMPEGCNHSEIWNFIMMIERCAGDATGLKPWFEGMKKDECWYYLTKASKEDMDELAAIASPESHMNNYVRRIGMDDYGLLSFVFPEVASLARHDGLRITESAIREIWLGLKPPHTPDEKVIANLMQAFYGMGKQIAGNYFSRMLIHDIHEMLVGNLGHLDLAPATPRFDAQLAMKSRLSDSEYIADMLDVLIKASRRAASMTDIVIVSTRMSDCLWDLSYVPQLKCLTEFLIRRAFFLMKDVPALSYVPFSSEDELAVRPFKQAHESEALYNTGEGLCSNWLVAGGIKAYLLAARSIRDRIVELEKEQEFLEQQIASIRGLNARQKTFAVTVARNPSRSFKIQDYVTMHEVAYATARHDLLDLVQRGILTMGKVERAFVFQGALTLDDRRKSLSLPI